MTHEDDEDNDIFFDGDGGDGHGNDDADATTDHYDDKYHSLRKRDSQ